MIRVGDETGELFRQDGRICGRQEGGEQLGQFVCAGGKGLCSSLLHRGPCRGWVGEHLPVRGDDGLAHAGEPVKPFGLEGSIRSERGGSGDQIGQQRSAGQHVWPAAGQAPHR
jgi:hypothetical protein